MAFPGPLLSHFLFTSATHTHQLFFKAVMGSPLKVCRAQANINALRSPTWEGWEAQPASTQAGTALCSQLHVTVRSEVSILCCFLRSREDEHGDDESSQGHREHLRSRLKASNSLPGQPDLRQPDHSNVTLWLLAVWWQQPRHGGLGLQAISSRLLFFLKIIIIYVHWCESVRFPGTGFFRQL